MPERIRASWRKDASYARVFLAIDLPDTIKDLIAIELRALRSLARDYRLKLAWTRQESLHLTLAFVASADPSGIEDIELKMTDIAKSVQPFNLAVGGGGAFPSLREPSVLWLGVLEGADSLCALARSTQAAVTAIGYPQSSRPYNPHLTIARSRRIQDVGAIVAAATKISLPTFLVSEVALFRSHLGSGTPRYERLASFALAVARHGDAPSGPDEA